MCTGFMGMEWKETGQDSNDEETFSKGEMVTGQN